MNEKFDAIPLLRSKSWSVTDEGFTYGKDFYKFDSLKKVELTSISSMPIISVVPVSGSLIVEAKNLKIMNVGYLKKDKERAEQAIDFLSKKVEESAIESRRDIIYSLDGARGRHMDVFNDRVCIINKATLGSLFTGNVTDGVKEIYYSDVISVQAKAPSVTLGYIQLETASVMMNNGRNNFFNENTFTYNESDLPNSLADEVVNFIKNKVSEYKSNKNAPVVAQLSPADELKKFKELFDMGIINQDEFDAKKKELLGL